MLFRSRQVTKGHKYYADCTKLLGVRYVDGIGWQQLKKDISLMYGHCYKCGIPNVGYKLSKHRENLASGRSCPYEDFLGLIWWQVFNDEVVWKAFSDFYSFKLAKTRANWVKWLKSAEDGLFYVS